MSTYLIINIIIIIFPIIFSFEKKIRYRTKLKSLLPAITAVGIPFILWDSAAAARGDWRFNPLYVSGFTVFNLPYEEILFFITVPYSTIFMYEVICYYIKQKQVHVDRYYIYITAAAALASAVMLRSFSYTFSVLVFFIVLVLLSSAGFGVFKYKNFWLWIGASFLPFGIFNYVLTSLPVVIYSKEAILGIRAATIPVEDFLYSFVLLTSYLTAYLAIENVWKIKKT